MKKIILEIKGKKYSLREDVPRMAKQYIAQGLKIAIGEVESQLRLNKNKHAQKFGRDLIAHFRIEQSRYIHEETDLDEGYQMELGNHEFLFKNKDDADHARMLFSNRVPLADIPNALSKAGIPFKITDTDTLSFQENALSAKRIVRRALKMTIDEYKRNTKNGEVFAILAQVIMSLKKYIKTLEELEEPGALAGQEHWDASDLEDPMDV